MNQSILFPDIQDWNDERKVICFPAQSSGALIECSVSLSQLEIISGRSLQTAKQALDTFSEYRFDIEERAEELIEQEAFSASGSIEIEL
ncbi:DUF1488 domain-containing protein [Vibrio sp. ZSDE26]|uniref:DUF1488 domain-containing protein n=1 Tax=Vibrio amylolyticus TaxID=2847292 RepID=A0A9X2BLH9_9VIBR|nr:DUF1488 domain-containing protein [Vibrio amylolyticus]MCK6265657.1 DUF1488 domain-containing protein [Vibrio amylolyticus]